MVRRRKVSFVVFGALLALGAGMTGVAQAGSTFFPMGATEFGVKVTSLKERKFDGVIRQQYDFSCGSAALATLLTHYYERPLAETDVFLRMYEVGDQEQIKKVGFSLLDMKTYLQSIGLRSDGFRVDDLDILEKAGVPVIALIDVRGYRHFVVIMGITDDGVLIGDPAAGKTYKSRRQFMETWDKVAFVIRDEGQIARKYFNSSRSWDGLTTPPLSTALNSQTLHSFTTNNMSMFSFDRF